MPPATRSACSPSRSATTTRAPSTERRRQIAEPIPPAPPVTNAVRPWREAMSCLLLAADHVAEGLEPLTGELHGLKLVDRRIVSFAGADLDAGQINIDLQ